MPAQIEPAIQDGGAKIAPKPEIPGLDLATALQIALSEAQDFNKSIDDALKRFDAALDDAALRFEGALQDKVKTAKNEVLKAKAESLSVIDEARERSLRDIAAAMSGRRRGYSPSNPRVPFED